MKDLVLVGYTSQKTIDSIKFCERSFRSVRFANKLLVCNSSALLEGPSPAGWTVLQGSNSFAEFSGWQEGLNHLLAAKAGRSGVLFLNDTVDAHRRFSIFRSRAMETEIRFAAPRTIVGFVDHGENDIGDFTIAGMELPGWVSTFCFFLGAQTLQRLDHQLYWHEALERFVPGGPDLNSFLSADLSNDLKRQLQSWLFEGGWYQSAPLTAGNAEFFTKKARLICAEWLLSARCWKAGCTRRDPFERHPLARALDRRSEALIRRFGLSRRAWAVHPQPWSKNSASTESSWAPPR